MKIEFCTWAVSVQNQIPQVRLGRFFVQDTFGPNILANRYRRDRRDLRATASIQESGVTQTWETEHPTSAVILVDVLTVRVAILVAI